MKKEYLTFLLVFKSFLELLPYSPTVATGGKIEGEISKWLTGDTISSPKFCIYLLFHYTLHVVMSLLSASHTSLCFHAMRRANRYYPTHNPDMYV